MAERKILVLGAVGTQVVIDGLIAELVERGSDGRGIWRARCEVCHDPIFAETHFGQLPNKRRCLRHRKVEVEAPELTQAELGEKWKQYPEGTVSSADFLLPAPTEPKGNGQSAYQPEMIAASPRDHHDKQWVAIGERGEFVEAPFNNDKDFNTSLANELSDLAENDIPPPPDERSLWGPRLNLYRTNRMWSPGWGARPDQNGCECPEGLLKEFGF